MSTRFGIELALDPAFTARAYRTRNIVCGLYGSWAAEMHMLRMSVVSYFQYPAINIALLAHGVGRLAEASRDRSPGFSISCLGVANGRNGLGDGLNGENNNIYLDFQQTDASHPLEMLYREAMSMLEGLPNASLPIDNEIFHPKINLMEYANLPPTVMADAADFAKGVATDVGVPAVALAWRLVLLRYHSDAAGDNWSNGNWASDVSWEHLSSYVL